ncbi:calcitonin gene-related peptide-like isoform X2 [Triplophysa dalaica]|uniref:calcitonin gene-related peptide-like isoform X2 n=1 Tax=Triplophysa dalaica TaxID=1582913 RepID=UPI0024DFC3EF|nr:calcitonin gene-related peptide-like isoform X2 [Triplophysa dalaica]
MFLLKISPVLVAYAVIVCQMSCSQAAPVRGAPDSLTDRIALMDFETRRLLSAIVKSVVQMTAEEPVDEDNGSVTAHKRACNTATCVTHRLADFLSRSGGVGNRNFIPTNVGSKAFGRRRRNLQLQSRQP